MSTRQLSHAQASRWKRPFSRSRRRKRLFHESLEQRLVLTSVGLLADGTLLIQDVTAVGEQNDLSLQLDFNGDIRVLEANTRTLDVDVGSGVRPDPTDPRAATVPVALVSRIDVQLGEADDRLTVSFVNGNPVVAGGLDYDGGGQFAGGGDALTLNGGTFDTVEHRLLSAHDGSVHLDGSTITYVGLEPIDDNTMAGTRIFSFTAADETIRLSDDGDAGDNESLIDSTEGESIEFVNPSTELIIQTGALGGSGADIVSTEGLDSLFGADVTYVAEDDDQVIFQSVATFTNGGSVDVTGGVISVQPGITLATTNGVFPAGDIQFAGHTITAGVASQLLANDLGTPGDISLLATAVAFGDPDNVEPTDILAAATPSITVDGATLSGDNVSLSADATADVSVAADLSLNGSVSVGAILATASAVIEIIGGRRY